MPKNLSFCISLLLLAISYSAFSQQLLIKGIVRDTSRSKTYSGGRISVILNDTINRGVPKYEPVLKKNNLTEEEKLEMKLNSERFLKAYSKWDSLRYDQRFIVTANSSGEFEILAEPTDSLVFQSPNFVPQRFSVKDLLLMKSINILLQPTICEPRFICDDGLGKLQVIIAEKIEVRRNDPISCRESSILMDGRYEAKYKLIKSLYGTLTTDTIMFTAFDHYGDPPFGKHQYVMLFLSEHCGRLFHEKYLYFDVYPTDDGRWARPGDPYRFDSNVKRTVAAQKIVFKDNLTFDLNKFYPQEVKLEFNEPYFKLTKETAYPLTGAYVEDLFEIKKAGVLKARGFIFNN